MDGLSEVLIFIGWEMVGTLIGGCLVAIALELAMGWCACISPGALHRPILARYTSCASGAKLR